MDRFLESLIPDFAIPGVMVLLWINSNKFNPVCTSPGSMDHSGRFQDFFTFLEPISFPLIRMDRDKGGSQSGLKG